MTYSASDPNPEEHALYFDAFAAGPFGFLKHVSSSRMLWALPILYLLLGLVTFIEGTLGGSSDFQLWSDVERILNVDSTDVSSTSFPLVRDYPTWILILTISITFMVVHRQWIAFSTVLIRLRKNSVIAPKVQPRFSLFARLLRYDRIEKELSEDGSLQPPDHLAAALVRVNWLLRTVGSVQVLVSLMAAAFVAVIVLGQGKTGIFAIVAPDDMSRVDRAEWLELTYRSWWASTEHVGGVLLYGAIGTFTVFVILLQNIVGFAALYVILAIPTVEDFGADWRDPDGSYGWRPLAEAYRTVVRSIAVHGIALSLIVATLGVNNFRWMLFLWVLWIAILPLYLVLPRLAFSRVDKEVRSSRSASVRQLAAPAADLTTVNKVFVEQVIRSELEFLSEIRINPLKLPRREIPALVIGLVVPSALAIAQTFFSFRFGP